MKFVSAAGMREGEAQAIRRDPSLDRAMMGHAGKGLARAIRILARNLDDPDPAVRLLAGPGNNGGDLFAAALELRRMGSSPELWLACRADSLKGTARHFFERMAAEGIPFKERVEDADWDRVAAEALAPPILVDGLLGTGAKGEPRGAIRRAVDYLRARRGECLIVSADIPTGMNADSGAVGEHAVQADFTVTMEFPKAGMAAPMALEALGSLWRVPVGLPGAHADAVPDACPGLQWISEDDLRRALPRRARNSHKGTYGTALLLGGSAQYPGAIVLAAEGAVRSGAGLVRVATVPTAAAAIVARCPEVIVHSDLTADVQFDGMDAVLVGPGLGRDPEARRLVARLLHEASCPLVLDADAIAILAGKPEAVRACPQPVVLTPHPGELARLLGTDAATVQRDRQAAVAEAAQRTGAVVVLKGAGTLVAREKQPVWINLSGNPGMACGGSGDVLAGLLAGLLAQGIDPFRAACAAVGLHGTAGDLAALRKGQAAMKAGDLADALPAAFKQLAR